MHLPLTDTVSSSPWNKGKLAGQERPVPDTWPEERPHDDPK